MLSVRKVEASDRDLLNAAAFADPYHRAIGLTGEYWIDPNSIFYEDEFGPVVALKTTQLVRSDIQFLTQDRARNAKALLEGFWKYADLMRNRKVKEIIFNTQSPEVRHFFEKRFQFREVTPVTLSLRID